MAAAGRKRLPARSQQLMEASIKMAEQLAPNRRSDPGRTQGLVGRGLRRVAGPILKLTAIAHQRFSSPYWSGDEVREASRERRSRLAVAPWPRRNVRAKRPSIAPFAENVGVGAPGT
jgi:hypothetical protein